MTRRNPGCRAIEAALLAVATGEAGDSARRAEVDAHVRGCPACGEILARYRAIDALVGGLGPGDADAAGLARARQGLDARLAELRRRLVGYRVFPSPLGPMLIAQSEEGVALVEYVEGEPGERAVRLLRRAGLVPQEDGAEVESVQRQLLEFLAGERRRLDWPLDFRLARSDFQRDVLRVTADLPYGAVTSYGHVARSLGRPDAVRAVAQALRWNPLPIVVPCHRVVGGTGALTGYAGDRLGLKQRLLSLEGVPTAAGPRLPRIVRAAMYAHADGETEYCLPTCGSFATTPLSRLTLFGGRPQAEGTGLRPCSMCRPDLYPLPP